MIYRERESFFKSFLLFYLSMQLLVGVIAFLYEQSQVAQAKKEIFLEMQNYSLTLKGERFTLNIVDRTPSIELFSLYEGAELSAYFPIPSIEESLLKVTLDREKLDQALAPLHQSMRYYLLLSVLVLALVAFLFSLYALRPLRQSYHLLEEFLKDMIHDLNTPVTSILLNAKLLKKGVKPERIDRIELSARTIAGLHQNLESLLREHPLELGEVDLKALIEARVDYFQALYSDLNFEIVLDPVTLKSSKIALERIVDNLLSNACKYNRDKGWVIVRLTQEALTVEDSGRGIENPEKVFERYYKESERGLGLGLHIVKKLCEALGFSIGVESSEKGSVFTMSLR